MTSSPHDSKAPSDDDVTANFRLKHLKTKEECRLLNDTLEAWIVELPSKHAEGILRTVKENVPGFDNVDLQHLRRFAKPKYLPPHVVGARDRVKEMYAVPRTWEDTPPAVIQADSSSVWEWSSSSRARPAGRGSTLYLLICPINIVSLTKLQELLRQHPPFSPSENSWVYPLELKTITVPSLAPTSPSQATEWSTKYWPTFYRKTNPFGAHPATISRAEQEVQQSFEGNLNAEEIMGLAEKVADDNRRRGLGVNTGCAIVERLNNQTEIIAVAGDARHGSSSGVRLRAGSDCPQGNVMGHSVMRALGFVGRKRLRVASQPTKKHAAKAESNFANGGLGHDEVARDAFFLDLPATPLEKAYFDKDNIKPDGYLCLKLEVYLTHEPCVMCSMALVHSRVGRVIFKKRMTKTGGLTAEVVSNDSGPAGLGYGLCWRKELNWQFMCWEYMPKDDGNGEDAITSAPCTSTSIISTDTNPAPQDCDDGCCANANAEEHSFASVHV